MTSEAKTELTENSSSLWEDKNRFMCVGVFSVLNSNCLDYSVSVNPYTETPFNAEIYCRKSFIFFFWPSNRLKKMVEVNLFSQKIKQ